MPSICDAPRSNPMQWRSFASDDPRLRSSQLFRVKRISSSPQCFVEDTKAIGAYHLLADSRFSPHSICHELNSSCFLASRASRSHILRSHHRVCLSTSDASQSIFPSGTGKKKHFSYSSNPIRTYMMMDPAVFLVVSFLSFVRHSGVDFLHFQLLQDK